MSRKIHLDAPCVGESEKKYLCQAIDSGFVSSVGPFIGEFETKMAQYLGAKAAVAVASGTAALYMALHECRIGPGDEVIVPALTFTATVNPVLYLGATPVIVDVDPNTWTIDPQKVRNAITPRTKAIVPVHIYGNPSDLSEILNIAKQHGLKIIEDATESLGGHYDGKSTGTWGDLGCFSFNGNKLITTGGGGMIVGNDVHRIDHIRYLINQAKDAGHPGRHSEMGFNFRMTNVEAALGLAQMERLESFLNKKKAFNEIYRRALGNIPGVHFQTAYPPAESSCWLTCLRLLENDIARVIQQLERKGIPARRAFMPLDQMPYLKDYASACPVSTEIYNQGICLPSSTVNDPSDIGEVASVLKEVLYG